MDLQADPVVSAIRERLAEHPHFRGRTHLIRIHSHAGSVVVSGRVPTYYLKQLVQEVVKLLPEVATIDNRVDVLWPRR